MRHKEWVPPLAGARCGFQCHPQGALHTGRQVTPLAVDELSSAGWTTKGPGLLGWLWMSYAVLFSVCVVITDSAIKNFYQDDTQTPPSSHA